MAIVPLAERPAFVSLDALYQSGFARDANGKARRVGGTLFGEGRRGGRKGGHEHRQSDRWQTKGEQIEESTSPV